MKFRLQRKKAYHVPYPKGHSTPTSTDKSIQNDVCTSTIIVVFAFHGAFLLFLKFKVFCSVYNNHYTDFMDFVKG